MKKLFIFLLCLSNYNLFSQIGFQKHELVSGFKSSINNTVSLDVDQDGDLDIITASSRSDESIVWHENINGLFKNHHIIALQTELQDPFILCLADLDNDGDLDLLSGSDVNKTMVCYKNQGNGLFEKQLISDDAQSIRSIATGDIDNDGKLDIIIASIDEGVIYWYKNKGNFSFEAPIKIGRLSTVGQVITVDIDNDGNIDVLAKSVNAINTEGDLALFKNQGGTFETIRILDRDIYDVFAADINNDTYTDLVIRNDTRKLVWRENKKNGFFKDVRIIAKDGSVSESIYAFDYDQDGDLDIIARSRTSQELYTNINGTGGFSKGKHLTYQFGNLSSGDIDNDGFSDIICSSDIVFWLKNLSGSGEFVKKPLLVNSYNINHLEPLDLDNDGDKDIIFSSINNSTSIGWLENLDGNGNFGQITLLSENRGNNYITSGDINNDGKVDLISGSNHNGMRWLKNIGDNKFESNNILNGSIIKVQTVDIDNDNDLDLVGDIHWQENTDGLGTFNTPNNINGNSSKVEIKKIIDYDNDKDIDIIALDKENNQIIIFENSNSYGSYKFKKSIKGKQKKIISVDAADIDGDGDGDLIALINLDITIFQNLNGIDSFVISQNIKLSGKIISIFTADINNDNKLDIIVKTRKKIEWYQNLDDGVFDDNPQLICNNKDHDSRNPIFANDIDGDGDVDIVSTSVDIISSRIFQSTSWWENLGRSNKIIGKIQVDLGDNNCEQNNKIISNILVTASQNNNHSFSTFTTKNGQYVLPVDEGIYSVDVKSNLPSHYESEEQNSINFIEYGNTDNLDFCIRSSKIINDIFIDMYPITTARPGFVSKYLLVYKNMGTRKISGTIQSIFNNEKLSFESASESSIMDQNSLQFNFTNIEPFETRTIELSFKLKTPPLVNIGEKLIFENTITIENDINLDDNFFNLHHLVIGSFDPNDIRVLEGDSISIKKIDQYIHYIIRFQNTGNYFAENVKIKNTLDDNFDWSTLEIESASHSNQITVLDGKNLTINFNHILLQDSTHNEAASHGYIAYKIKPKKGLKDGDIFFKYG